MRKEYDLSRGRMAASIRVLHHTFVTRAANQQLKNRSCV